MTIFLRQTGHKIATPLQTGFVLLTKEIKTRCLDSEAFPTRA